MTERPNFPPTGDAESEAELFGAVECPSCHGVYRVQDRRLACENCGTPVALVEDLPEGKSRRAIGSFAYMKSVADNVDKSMAATGMMVNAGSSSARQRTEGHVSCSWCGRHYDSRPESPNCESCGGVLPMPIGFNPGPAPPAAPRRLPSGFRWRIYVTQNLGGTIGLIALAISMPLCCLAFPLGVVLFLCGGATAYSNYLMKIRRCHALKNGTRVLGKIEAVHRYGNPKDGKPLYRVYFRFDAEGEPVRGMKFTYDPAIEEHFVGEPVWIVYMPRKLTCYDTYPPFA